MSSGFSPDRSTWSFLHVGHKGTMRLRPLRSPTDHCGPRGCPTLITGCWRMGRGRRSVRSELTAGPMGRCAGCATTQLPLSSLQGKVDQGQGKSAGVDGRDGIDKDSGDVHVRWAGVQTGGGMVPWSNRAVVWCPCRRGNGGVGGCSVCREVVRV